MRKSRIKIFKNQKSKNQKSKFFFKNQKSKFFKIPVMNTNTQPKFSIYI